MPFSLPIRFSVLASRTTLLPDARCPPSAQAKDAIDRAPTHSIIWAMNLSDNSATQARSGRARGCWCIPGFAGVRPFRWVGWATALACLGASRRAMFHARRLATLHAIPRHALCSEGLGSCCAAQACDKVPYSVALCALTSGMFVPVQACGAKQCKEVAGKPLVMILRLSVSVLPVLRCFFHSWFYFTQVQ